VAARARRPCGAHAGARDRSQLDTLPLPAWDLVDVAKYESLWRARHGYFSMNIVDHARLPVSLQLVREADLRPTLYRAHRPSTWSTRWPGSNGPTVRIICGFADDIFGLKPGWIERFAELVQARDAADPVQVPAACRPGDARRSRPRSRPATAARCGSAPSRGRSGFSTRWRRGRASTRSRRRRSCCAPRGIEVGFFLQFGYPGETRDDIEQTLQMVRACQPDDIGVSVSYPLPGTPFYERVKSQLGDKQNWLDSDDLAMMYSATYSPDFYRALYALVHSEFRVRKSLQARNPIGLVRHWLRLPLLRRRLERLSAPLPNTVPLLVPLSSPHAAAIPTDQRTLK
jgi:hypothetical protein